MLKTADGLFRERTHLAYKGYMPQAPAPIDGPLIHPYPRGRFSFVWAI
jgi:hypothetical protein